ncbi:MAG TPA: YncE family protein [Bryobacteraceae bacterium]|nr:YncE family protein [Bryobacteraceae bacterium]
MLSSSGESLAAEHPWIAVVEKAAGAVGFYTRDGRRIAGVKVGAFPHEAVLSPDGRLLYVSDNGVLWMTEDGGGGNTISIIDVQTMKRVGVIDLGRFRRPHGITFDRISGHLFATTERPYGLIEIDPVAGKVVRDFDIRGRAPHMVMVTPRGDWAFASNVDSDAVAAVELKTGKVTLIPTGARPQGGVFSPDASRLYVVNTGAAQISIIDPRRLQVVGTIPVGKGPGRIAITPDGKTLVYNLQVDLGVGFADIASRKQVAALNLGGRPLSLTMTPDGKLAFAGVQDQDKVFVISVPERKVLRVIETPKGAGPDPAIPLISE